MERGTVFTSPPSPLVQGQVLPAPEGQRKPKRGSYRAHTLLTSLSFTHGAIQGSYRRGEKSPWGN